MQSAFNLAVLDGDAGSSGDAPLPPFAALPEELANIASSQRGIDAVYVHVPFCSTKCHYCDFYSIAGHLDQAEAFLDALNIELQMHIEVLGKPRPRTIFIGGGTPTLLSPKLLERFLATLTATIEMSRVEEFTIEANPNTFDGEKAKILREHGINRISFGAQSFVASELRMLQRDHDPESVPKAVEIARKAGINNVNLDLIFGIPGQTPETWEFSLARALELAPDHMSCYSLTYELNTAMTARLKRGEFAALDEQTELEMFTHVYDRLRGAGFVRYEVSNYARRDADAADGAKVCRHNQCYWKGGNWLGLGPSAGTHLSSYPLVEGAGPGSGAWRWKNVAGLNHYLAALAERRLPLTQLECMSAQQWAAEVAVFWLRLSEGINYAEFTEQVGVDVRAGIEKGLRKYEGMNLVELSLQKVRILEAGVAVSNHLLADVLAVLSPRPA